jgi:hypothetical protein
MTRVSILHVKLAHTLIFAVVGACVLYTLYCGVTNQLTRWTWIGAVIVLAEGAVLAANGWRCPLTTYAERLGAADGAVAGIFLPKWFARRVFSICGLIFATACVLVAVRWFAARSR